MKTMILLLSFILAGCTVGYSDQSDEYTNLPPELKNCKIYKITSSNGGILYVTKCPHADTTTEDGGKNSQAASIVYTPTEHIKHEPPQTVIIDGIEYKR